MATYDSLIERFIILNYSHLMFLLHNYSLHTYLLIFAIIILFSILIVALICRGGILESSPTILTSTGILFTFIGISIGLFQFNTSNNDPSANINNLLAGLKLAFVPSAVAVFLSIILKLFISKNTDTKVVDKLTNELQLISASVDNHSQLMLSELKTFQLELTNRHVLVLTESLQQILNQFNLVISDNLSQSFNTLSSSVNDLLSWQKEYKETLMNLGNDYRSIVNGVKDSADAYQKSSDSLAMMADSYAKVEKSIYAILQTISDTQKDLEDSSDVMLRNINELDNNLIQQIGLVNKHISKNNDILNSFNNTASTMADKISRIGVR